MTPKIGDTVSLCYSERDIAVGVGFKMHTADSGARRKEMKCSPTDGLIMHIEGAAGELAFSKLFNVYPPLVVVSGGDFPLFEVRLPDGRRVDVKTTKYDDGKLVVAKYKGDKGGVQLYALLTGEFPGPWTYRGVMAQDELIVPGRIEEPRPGKPAYVALQRELREIDR